MAQNLSAFYTSISVDSFTMLFDPTLHHTFATCFSSTPTSTLISFHPLVFSLNLPFRLIARQNSETPFPVQPRSTSTASRFPPYLPFSAPAQLIILYHIVLCDFTYLPFLFAVIPTYLSRNLNISFNDFMVTFYQILYTNVFFQYIHFIYKRIYVESCIISADSCCPAL